jgi:hypothetical protein
MYTVSFFEVQTSQRLAAIAGHQHLVKSREAEAMSSFAIRGIYRWNDYPKRFESADRNTAARRLCQTRRENQKINLKIWRYITSTKETQSCACVQAFQRIKRPVTSSKTDKISEVDQREFWETRNERLCVLFPPSATSSALPVA